MAERTSTGCGSDLEPRRGRRHRRRGSPRAARERRDAGEGVVTDDIVTVWIIDEEQGRVPASCMPLDDAGLEGQAFLGFMPAGGTPTHIQAHGDQRRDPPDVAAAPMSSWFDKLLEELQRRQAGGGRPPRGPSLPARGAQRHAHRRGAAATRRRGRTGRATADGGRARRSRGRLRKRLPWRRWVVIGGGILVGDHRARAARRGGQPHHRRDVVRRARSARRPPDPAVGADRPLRDRLRGDARAGAGQRLAGAPDRAAGAGPPARRHSSCPDVSRRHRHRARRRGGAARARHRRPPGAALGDRPPLPQRRGVGHDDPTLGRDIGFYVFDLPFWRFLLGWAIDDADHRRAAHAWRRTRRGRCAGSST